MDFVDGEEVGAITAHTCANTIIFPRGVFVDTSESYELFREAMKAVIGLPAFNLEFNMV